MAERFAVIEEHVAGSPSVGGDVTREALERRWIEPFADGQFVYRAPWSALLRVLQDQLRRRALDHLGFEEWLFPRLIPTQAIEAFELSHYVPEMLFEVQDRDLVLDPVQCISLYHLLSQDCSVLRDGEPLRVVECMGGWTWRNEDPSRLDGTVRTIEFARVEHLWLGTAEQAKAARGEVLRSVLGLIRDLDLSYRVVVGEGCMEIAELDQARDAATTVPDIPVLDIELPLLAPDAAAARGGDPFEEIAGCTVEGTHLTRRFGILDASGDPLSSGCCGVGLNRLVTGFLFQHGFEPERWPELARTRPGQRTAQP